MSTAASGADSLRSPADSSWPPPTGSSTSGAPGLRTPTDGLDRPGVVDAWIGAPRHELSTTRRSAVAAGGQLGMESSINKVFWSRWDIAAHETALAPQGPTPNWPTAGPTATSSHCRARSTRVPTDPTQRHRRATPRPAPRGPLMEFLLDDEHVGLAETIDGLASRLDAVAANRAWADGDTAPGLKLWSSLAELGIWTPRRRRARRRGAGAIEMTVAAEALGRHAVPGPVAETLAAVPIALRSAGRGAELASLAEGSLATIAVGAWQPAPPTRSLRPSTPRRRGSLASERPSSRWSPSTRRAPSLTSRPARHWVPPMPTKCSTTGALATAAQLLGLGTTMLDLAAEYAKTRQQFGRDRFLPGGQTPPRRLAIALEMARPLVHGAALCTRWSGSRRREHRPRGVRAGLPLAMPPTWLRADPCRCWGRSATQLNTTSRCADQNTGAVQSAWARRPRTGSGSWRPCDDHRDHFRGGPGRAARFGSRPVGAPRRQRSRARGDRASDRRTDERLWEGLTEIGAPALAIPEELGGVGAGWTGLAAVVEEVGAALAPVPCSRRPCWRPEPPRRARATTVPTTGRRCSRRSARQRRTDRDAVCGERTFLGHTEGHRRRRNPQRHRALRDRCRGRHRSGRSGWRWTGRDAAPRTRGCTRRRDPPGRHHGPDPTALRGVVHRRVGDGDRCPDDLSSPACATWCGHCWPSSRSVPPAPRSG